MSGPTRSVAFIRTTHREINTTFDENGGFLTCAFYLSQWKKLLNKTHIEQHLDKDHWFPSGHSMLISLPALTADENSLRRAVQYATSQKQDIFLDETYEDPDVWLHWITCATLVWDTVLLGGRNRGRTMRVLREPGDWSCCFFSTNEAKRVFGIQSRWATKDEWFAIGHIPARLVSRHIQLAHGLIAGKPYKLVPVHPSWAPQRFVELPRELGGSASWMLDQTDREADKQGQKACEVADRRLLVRRPWDDNAVFQMLGARLGMMQRCVIDAMCR